MPLRLSVESSFLTSPIVVVALLALIVAMPYLELAIAVIEPTEMMVTKNTQRKLMSLYRLELFILDLLS